MNTLCLRMPDFGTYVIGSAWWAALLVGWLGLTGTPQLGGRSQGVASLAKFRYLCILQSTTGVAPSINVIAITMQRVM
jgi:hypothetical protein